jgi:tetratricopeptide (TPR) repeat protein
MRRHDHTMLPPTPAATIQFQSPNACNLCHEDQTAQWSDEWVRQWYSRDYQAPLLRRAQLIAAARRQDWSQLPGMIDFISNTNGNEIFSASLLRLLESCPEPAKWPAFRKALRHPSPLVRACAALGLADCPDRNTSRVLVEATADTNRLVRIQAASALARRGVDPSEGADRIRLQEAFSELEASMRCQPDGALSHYNLGLYHQNRGNLSEAVEEYQLAQRMYPSFLPVHVNLSLLLAAQGKHGEAEQLLRAAQSISQTNAAVNFNLGLLLAEQNRPAEAEGCFRAVLQADPGFAAAAYNLAVLMAGRDLQETLALCRRAAELMPEEPKYAYTLAFYLRQSGNVGAAGETLRALLKRHPHYDMAIALLGSIYEETDRIPQALELYRLAVADERLPQRARFNFSMRLRALEPAN